MFRVAETVGSTVASLHENITVEEFNGWVLYFNSKPADVMEVQMAVLTNIVAAAAGVKNTKVADFILSGDNQPKDTGKSLQEKNFASFAALAQPFKPSKK